jgi:hypothetical protein
MDGKRKAFLVALVIGLASGPVLAFGATRILGSAEAEAAPATTTAAPTTTVPEVPAADDLAAACGAEGATLVAGEAAGTLSELQQAALDALRPICASAGLPLAPASVPGAGPGVGAGAAPQPTIAALPAGGGEPEEHEVYEEHEESEEYEAEGGD